MNIFVTGGTGFIGSYVVNELVANGHNVTILARNPKKVKGFLNHPNIQLLKGSLYDNDVIKEGLYGKDACIHIALGWGDTPIDMLENDTKASLYIFEKAVELGVKQIIYTSSTAAIGEFRPLMKVDIDCRPIDLYGATKAATEAYLLAIATTKDIRCNIIRPGYVFGNPVVEGAPMQPDGRFRKIVENSKQNKPINLVKNDGTQFIWAGDLAKIYLNLVSSHHNRQIFLGLSTKFVTWEEIAQYAIDYIGSKSDIILEDKGLEKDGSLFDVSLLKEEFGYAFTPFEHIKRHIEYIADNE
jgi:UDP-glucose 4-epimerase